MTALDHDFFIPDATERKRLGQAPTPGIERLVCLDGQHFWYTRTQHNGRMVLALQKTNWILRDGRAVLE